MHSIIKRHFLAGLAAWLLSCGAGSESAGKALQSQADLESLAARFEGVEGIETIDSSSFLISWPPLPTDKPVSYGIFKGPSADQIDYNVAHAVVESDGSLIYRPKSAFFDDTECFAVRVVSVEGDANTATSCIAAQPFDFSGLSQIEQKSDGAYLLRWNAIPITGVTYSVYQRDINGEYDFSKPPSIAGISKNFEETDVIARGSQLCFIVRYNPHIQLPSADVNEAEQCSDYLTPLEFAGVKKVEALNVNEVRVSWELGQTPGIVSYRIYGGNEFDEILAVVEADQTEVIIGGRNAGVRYAFGVKATDIQGREDNNVEIYPIQMPSQ